MKIYPPTANGLEEMLKDFSNGEPLDSELAEKIEEAEDAECHHTCSSNCRREGCHCECGEWHNKEE